MARESGARSSAPAKSKGKVRGKAVATGTAVAEKKKAKNLPKDLVPGVPDYNWVRRDVGEFQGVFKSFLEINAIQRMHRICESSVSKFVRLEPCRPDERVYMGSSSEPPHFYGYQCLFRDLGVCLPFTQFECDFLNFINSAPCQLHPNSWGFFRAFQVLCSTLGIEVSLSVFLHFYQLKMGVPPYGLMSLNGRKAGGLFSLYSQSYKNFKQEFFRVALVGVDLLEDGAFYFGGLPKFPFY
uniref:Transposase (putative) gypsy type domain-containing protein n=1 Tax=Cajanus cajan TaxID=3821 RepID=A0A151S3T6_CAJCA|nr:hypothetical protein KK1_028806 [Cajanus cajan]